MFFTDDTVWVDWDTEHLSTYHYHYGKDGQYDILLVDEPRVPSPGNNMAVGCEVEQGRFGFNSNITLDVFCFRCILLLYLNLKTTTPIPVFLIYQQLNCISMALLLRQSFYKTISSWITQPIQHTILTYTLTRMDVYNYQY